MLLYTHRKHIYEDRERHVTLIFPVGSWKEVPDSMGAMLLSSWPDRFCDITYETNPSGHICNKEDEILSSYPTTAYSAPEENRMLYARMSPQKRQKLHQKMRQSRRARMDFFKQELGGNAEKQNGPKRGRPPKMRG